jgi:hypothetical protein
MVTCPGTGIPHSGKRAFNCFVFLMSLVASEQHTRHVNQLGVVGDPSEGCCAGQGLAYMPKNFVDVLMIEDGIDVLHRLCGCSSAWQWQDLYVPHVPLTNNTLTLAGVTAHISPYRVSEQSSATH